MATPIKANYTNEVVTSLGEFIEGDSVPITNGGTGATTAVEARANLGITDLLNIPSFTAGTTITAGQPVVLNSDGTVSGLSELSSQIFSLSALFDSSLDYADFAYCPTNRILIVTYKGASSYTYIAVATINADNTFTMGSIFTVDAIAVLGNPSVTYVDVGRFLVAWSTTATTVSCRVIDVTAARAITAGTKYTSTNFNTYTTNNGIRVRAASSTSALITVCGTSSLFGVGVILSGTVCSFGTPVTILTTTMYKICNMDYDSVTNRYLISCMYGTSAVYSFRLLTASLTNGVTTPIAGFFSRTLNATTTATTQTGTQCILPNGYAAVLCYIGGSVTGLSIINLATALPVYEMDLALPVINYTTQIAYHAVDKKLYIFTRAASTGYITSATLDYDDTTNTVLGGLTPLQTIQSSGFLDVSCRSSALYISTNNCVLLGYLGAGPMALLYREATSNVNDFLGLAHTSGNIGESVPINCKGSVVTGLVGLTPNTKYYLTAGGTLTTTVTGVYVGRAITTTKLLLM